jgi:regulator of RNase E activity RraA
MATATKIRNGVVASALTPDTRERLKRVSVATISTCLYRAGVKVACPNGIRPLAPWLPRMVGEAFTLRFIPMRDDVGGMASYAAGGNVHQRAFEECPPGHVLVMDARGDTRGCSCGDLLVGRLKARGCAGVVTDGGFRDTPDIALLEFPAYQREPAPAPSFGRLQAVELNVPIGCSDVAVYPGDIIVGDGEGIVVIPAKMAERIANEAHEMAQYDTFAAEEIARGRAVVGLYPATETSRTEFERWRKQRTGN